MRIAASKRYSAETFPLSTLTPAALRGFKIHAGNPQTSARAKAPPAGHNGRQRRGVLNEPWECRGEPKRQREREREKDEQRATELEDEKHIQINSCRGCMEINHDSSLSYQRRDVLGYCASPTAKRSQSEKCLVINIVPSPPPSPTPTAPCQCLLNLNANITVCLGVRDVL